MKVALAPVRHWMTHPAITVVPETLLARVEQTLDRSQISGLPVVDEEARLVGVISSTDLLRAPLEARSAGEVMSRGTVVAHPREGVSEVVWRMVASRIHRIIVIDDAEHVVGVFTPSDALPLVAERSGHERLADLACTSVVTIEIGQSTEEALTRLSSANVHGLVVVDGTAAVGLFSHVEALKCRRLPPTLRAAPVEATMGPAPVELDSSTPARQAARQMLARNARRIVLQRDRQLIGIVSAADLVTLLARALETHTLPVPATAE